MSLIELDDAIIYAGHDLEILSEAPYYHAWIVDYFLPYLRGHVVEIGAGTGSMSVRLAPLAERLDVIEPSANLIPVLEHRLAAHPHARVSRGLLFDDLVRRPDNSVDAVVLINVLEHIDDDDAALAEIARVLVPGGHLLLYVPALPMLMSNLDRVHGHFRRYMRRSLTAKVGLAGLVPLDTRYMDLPGVPAWLLLNTWGGKVTFNPRLIRVYDRLVVPLARRLESLIPPPIGKNLIMVAEKVMDSAFRQHPEEDLDENWQVTLEGTDRT